MEIGDRVQVKNDQAFIVQTSVIVSFRDDGCAVLNFALKGEKIWNPQDLKVVEETKGS